MYKPYLFTAIVLVVLLAGYFILATDTTDAPSAAEVAVQSAEEFTGTVTNVDRSQLMLDGPTIISVMTANGQNKTIAVPSMGLPLCAARDQIADTTQLAVGDTVTVRGRENETGAIVPCEDPADTLTIMGRAADETFGFEFAYRKGPDGYLTLEDNQSQHPNFVTGLRLYNAREYADMTASDSAREAPPAMHMRVYRNPEKLQSSVWVMRNQTEVNYQLMTGQESEAVVGGANAVHFITSGLYTAEVYVVAHGEHMYVLSGEYLDPDSAIYSDFRDLVNSFTFISAGEGVGTPVGKIDPQVACEQALTYMTFPTGADADAFIKECVNGEHPEVLERYLQDLGLDGAAI